MAMHTYVCNIAKCYKKYSQTIKYFSKIKNVFLLALK